MMNNISVNGLKEIQATFKKIDEQYHEDILKELTSFAYNKTKEKASKHNVTGKMERSVFHRFKNGEGLVGVDLQKAPYALFVHFGTKPHTIEPKEKRALRFTSSSAKFIFSRKVNHPGYKGDLFLHESLQETMKHIDKIADNILKEY